MRSSLAILITVALSAAGATAAQAASVGYVRLAHLSPDTPNVDVYLSSQSGAIPERTFKGVGYGAMTGYQTLPAGGYTVAMRPAGAPASQPPVLTTQVTVASGGALTVAGVGRYAELGLKILHDDLSLPGGNKAKVRIIQASVQVPLLNVTLINGPSIATNVAFATTTGYQLVPPGSWQLRIEPSGGGTGTNVSAPLKSGNVFSLLILDAGGGRLKTELRTDAGRQGGLPGGGVGTGGGGTAQSGVARYVWAGAAVLVLVLSAGVVFMIRRRRSTAL